METKETEAVSLSTLEPVRHGRFLRPTWHGSDGVRNLLIVSAPLIIGNVANSINLLVDRILLGIYSPSAFAAALQSGTVHWTLMGLATGLVTYAGTFIAQYTGARRPDRVGPALWQGVYLALICGGLAALLAIPAPAFFRWIGHEGVLPQLEAQYFQVFALGSVAFLLKECFACFYIGRGKTGVVMAVNAFTCVANILLNYRLIFSPPYPLPGGMRGSALASVIATLLGAAAFAVLIFSREHDSIFHVLRGWRPDFTLLARLIRFGLPSGAQWFIDMVAFSVFLLAIGKFGFEAQFASNVAMSANLLLFIPAIGIAQGATVLAGQFAGARRHERTEGSPPPLFSFAVCIWGSHAFSMPGSHRCLRTSSEATSATRSGHRFYIFRGFCFWLWRSIRFLTRSTWRSAVF